MYHIKRDKRSMQSCQRIYDSLIETMDEKEFSKITIKEVVNKAEVGRATFYRNFDYLEDVFRFELNKKFEELYQYLKKYYKSKPTYFLSFFITPFLKFWYLDSNIIEILMKTEKINLLHEYFEDLLKRGINEYDGAEPIIIDHLGYFLAVRSGIAINILLEWIKNEKTEAPEKLIEIIHEQMKSGLQQNMFK